MLIKILTAFLCSGQFQGPEPPDYVLLVQFQVPEPVLSFIYEVRKESLKNYVVFVRNLYFHDIFVKEERISDPLHQPRNWRTA